MEIINFPKNTNHDIVVELPNGKLFKSSLDELKYLFDNPNEIDKDDRNGLLKMVIAILYADYSEKNHSATAR